MNLSRHKWTAYKAGLHVADGSVDTRTAREAMQHVLASRDWPGRDWKLKVGSESVSFDEEDVPKLKGEIGNAHAKDEALPGQPVPKSIVQGAVDVLAKNRDPKRHGRREGESLDEFHKRKGHHQTAMDVPAKGVLRNAKLILSDGSEVPIDLDKCEIEIEIENRISLSYVEEDEFGAPPGATPVLDTIRELVIKGIGLPATLWDDPRSTPMEDFKRAVKRINEMASIPPVILENAPYDVGPHLTRGFGYDMQAAQRAWDKLTPDQQEKYRKISADLLDKAISSRPVSRPFRYLGTSYPGDMISRDGDRSVLTQSFARLGLPSNAAYFALKKMGARMEDVRGVMVSERNLIEVQLHSRVGHLGMGQSFTRAELEAAW